MNQNSTQKNSSPLMVRVAILGERVQRPNLPRCLGESLSSTVYTEGWAVQCPECFGGLLWALKSNVFRAKGHKERCSLDLSFF